MEEPAECNSAAKVRRRVISRKLAAEWVRSLTKYGLIICPVEGCVYRTQGTNDLKDHFAHCDVGNTIILFKCPQCGSSFESIDFLNLHYRISHGSSGGVTSTLRKSGENPPGTKGGELVTGSVTTEMSKSSSSPAPQPPRKTTMNKEETSLSRNTYIRKRAFHKAHVNSWNIFLERDGFIRCHLQGCKFIAQSIDEMKGHYGYCNGKNLGTSYECPFCKGQTTSAELLNAHIQRSHAVSDSIVTTVVEDTSEAKSDDDGVPTIGDKNTINMKVLLVGWRSDGYIRCPFRCDTILKKLFPLTVHLSSCKKAPSEFKAVCVCGFTCQESLSFLHHTKVCDAIEFHVKNVNTYNFDFQIAEEVLNTWVNMIEEKGFVRCNRCACLTFHIRSTIQHHSACIKESATVARFECTFCNGWTKSMDALRKHVFLSHSKSSEYLECISPETLPLIAIENSHFKIDNEFVCQYCEKCFEDLPSIQSHISEVHQQIIGASGSSSLVELWNEQIKTSSLCSCLKYPCSFATDTVLEMIRHFDFCNQTDADSGSPSSTAQNLENRLGAHASKDPILLDGDIQPSSEGASNHEDQPSEDGNRKCLAGSSSAVNQSGTLSSRSKNKAPGRTFVEKRQPLPVSDVPMVETQAVSKKFLKQMNSVIKKSAARVMQTKKRVASVSEPQPHPSKKPPQLSSFESEEEVPVEEPVEVPDVGEIMDVEEERSIGSVDRAPTSVMRRGSQVKRPGTGSAPNVPTHALPAFKACQREWQRLLNAKPTSREPPCTEPLGDDSVVCGLCGVEVLAEYFSKHKLIHYGLCWVRGEEPIDFNDENHCRNILTSYVSQLSKQELAKFTSFRCFLCQRLQDDPVDHVRHLRICISNEGGTFLGSGSSMNQHQSDQDFVTEVEVIEFLPENHEPINEAESIPIEGSDCEVLVIDESQLVASEEVVVTETTVESNQLVCGTTDEADSPPEEIQGVIGDSNISDNDSNDFDYENEVEYDSEVDAPESSLSYASHIPIVESLVDTLRPEPVKEQRALSVSNDEGVANSSVEINDLVASKTGEHVTNQETENETEQSAEEVFYDDEGATSANLDVIEQASPHGLVTEQSELYPSDQKVEPAVCIEVQAGSGSYNDLLSALMKLNQESGMSTEEYEVEYLNGCVFLKPIATSSKTTEPPKSSSIEGESEPVGERSGPKDSSLVIDNSTELPKCNSIDGKSEPVGERSGPKDSSVDVVNTTEPPKCDSINGKSEPVVGGRSGPKDSSLDTVNTTDLPKCDSIDGNSEPVQERRSGPKDLSQDIVSTTELPMYDSIDGKSEPVGERSGPKDSSVVIVNTIELPECDSIDGNSEPVGGRGLGPKDSSQDIVNTTEPPERDSINGKSEPVEEKRSGPKDSPLVIVKCGACGEEMPYNVYKEQHMAVHYGLSWLEGKTPIDLTNDELCTTILEKYQSSLKNPSESDLSFFRCIKCSKHQKGPKEHLKHIRACVAHKEGFTELWLSSNEKENWREGLESLKSRGKKSGLIGGRNFVERCKRGPSDIIKCGLCKEVMTYDLYLKKHREKHFRLCWIDGETPLDFFDEKKCMGTLMKYQSLFTKSKNKSEQCFSCFKCKENHESAPSHLRHLIVCVVKNEYKNKPHTSAKETVINPTLPARGGFDETNSVMRPETSSACRSSTTSVEGVVEAGSGQNLSHQEKNAQHALKPREIDKQESIDESAKSVISVAKNSIIDETQPGLSSSAGSIRCDDTGALNDSILVNTSIEESPGISGKVTNSKRASERSSRSGSRKQNLTETIRKESDIVEKTSAEGDELLLSNASQRANEETINADVKSPSSRVKRPRGRRKSAENKGVPGADSFIGKTEKTPVANIESSSFSTPTRPDCKDAEQAEKSSAKGRVRYNLEEVERSETVNRPNFNSLVDEEEVFAQPGSSVESEAEKSMNEPSSTAKKAGRGRPKKNCHPIQVASPRVDEPPKEMGSIQSNHEETSTENVDESKVKSTLASRRVGQGRPKKNLTESENGCALEVNNCSDQEPRLVDSEAFQEHSISETDQVSTKKVGRGRPKKKFDKISDKSASQVEERPTGESAFNVNSSLPRDEGNEEVMDSVSKGGSRRTREGKNRSLEVSTVGISPSDLDSQVKKSGPGRPRKSLENSASLKKKGGRNDSKINEDLQDESLSNSAVTADNSCSSLELQNKKRGRGRPKFRPTDQNLAETVQSPCDNSPVTEFNSGTSSAQVSDSVERKRGRGRPKVKSTNEDPAEMVTTSFNDVISSTEDKDSHNLTPRITDSSERKRGRGRPSRKSSFENAESRDKTPSLDSSTFGEKETVRNGSGKIKPTRKSVVEGRKKTEESLEVKELATLRRGRRSSELSSNSSTASFPVKNIGRGNRKRKAVETMSDEDDADILPVKKSRRSGLKIEATEEVGTGRSSRRTPGRGRSLRGEDDEVKEEVDDDGSADTQRGRRKSGRGRTGRTARRQGSHDDSTDEETVESKRGSSSRRSGGRRPKRKVSIEASPEDSSDDSAEVSSTRRKEESDEDFDAAAFDNVEEEASVVKPVAKRGKSKSFGKKSKVTRKPPFASNNRAEEEPVKESDDELAYKYQPSDTVKCALCAVEMTYEDYRKKHRELHFKLCWIEGETPLDLFDDTLMNNILTKYQSRFLWLKKKRNTTKVYRCFKCNNVQKSHVGHLSHIRICVVKEEDRQKAMVACEHCGKFMMRSSTKSHLKVCAAFETFKITDIRPENSLEPRSRRSAALKAESTIKQLSDSLLDTKEETKARRGARTEEDCDDDFEMGDETGSEEEYLSDSERTPAKLAYHYRPKNRLGAGIIRTWENTIANGSEASCIFPGCTFKSDEVEVMKDHHHNCPQTAAEDYVCARCPFRTDHLVEIETHARTVHKIALKKGAPQIFDRNSEVYCALYPPPDDSRFVETRIQRFGFTYDWTLQFVQEKLGDFPCFASIPPAQKLTPVEEGFLGEYLPTCSESVTVFSSKNFANKMEHSQFSLFEVENEENFVKIFVGGPIWSMAWAPTLVKEARQFLAVSAHHDMETVYTRQNTAPHAGLIQVWEFPRLSNLDKKADDPKLVFAIAHNYGTAWSMEWCPTAAAAEKKIGLLAVGFSCGTVAIYDIPYPENLPESALRHPVYKLEPSITLDLCVGDRAQCTRVAWQRVKPHNVLAAGFTSGTVGLWDLDTTSPLLKSGDVLLPYQTFQAHFSPISGLQFGALGDNRYIITCGSDRVGMCLWDLKDTTTPIFQTQQGLAKTRPRSSNMTTDLVWPNHWLTLISSCDDVFSTGSAALMTAVREFNYAVEMLVPQTAVNWSLSYCEWTGSIAVASGDGSVYMYAPGQLLRPIDPKHRNIRRRIMKTTVIYKDSGNPIKVKTKAKIRPFQLRPLTYKEATEQYGVKFIPEMEVFKIPGSVNDRQVPSNEVNLFPLDSVNKVAWNPNCQSFMWLAMGYQNGFLCVSRKDIVWNAALEKNYSQL